MKHAIFLRGALRTWNFNKEKILNFVNTIIDNPDWYLCFWESTTSTKEKICQDLQNCNLKFLHFENPDNFLKFNIPVFRNNDAVIPFNDKLANAAYWRPAYFDHILSIAKREYELANNIEYDSVTFIRPDALYETVDVHHLADKINNLKEMEILFQEPDFNPPVPFNSGIESYFVNDFLYIAGKIAADIYGTRFIDTNYTDGLKNQYLIWDPHTQLGLVQSNYQLITKNIDRAPIVDLIRPDDCHRFENLPNEIRSAMCEKFQIDKNDYGLE